MKLALFFITISIMLSSGAANCQAPQYLWASGNSGPGYDDMYAVAADHAGNCYSVGAYTATPMSFDSGPLTSHGGQEGFIVKYNNDGDAQWAQSVGGSGNEILFGVASDSNNDVIAVGTFYSPSIVFGSDTVTNTGQADVLIVKYDAAGNILWARSAGDSDIDYALKVVTDQASNIYVSGVFDSQTITFGTTVLTNAQPGYQDVFLVKYSPSGQVLWAVSGNGEGLDQPEGLAVDQSGNVLMTGYFGSPEITFGSTTLPNVNGFDIFITKLAPDGTFLWAESFGGTGPDYSRGVATDSQSNIYLAGFFVSPSLTIGTATLSNHGDADIFVAKLSPSGIPQWSRSAGGALPDFATGITVDSQGNPYIAGNYRSSGLTFGSQPPLTPVSASYDLLIAKYDTNGNALWSKSTGGTGYENALGITINDGNEIFAAGNFDSPQISFDLDTTFTTTSRDVFTAKLHDDMLSAGQFSNSHISISPNPAQDILMINGCKNPSSKIYDVHGRLMIESDQSQIPVGKLQTGIYFVRVSDGATFKLIKK